MLLFDMFFIGPVISIIIFGILFMITFVIIVSSIIRHAKLTKNTIKDISNIEKGIFDKYNKNANKITCEYCSSKIDAGLSKCPYCSASVNNKGEK